MRFLSLFSGIGGMDLGLERAGWQCAGQVEIDPFCRQVLAKHWPSVPRFEDVRSVTGELIRRECGDVDAIVGGPPCQPASNAGKRRGVADDRWLWPDFLRLVFELNPVWLLAENPRGVTSLRVEGLRFKQWLAREFAARGYELLPVELAAEDVGAPHKRERIWFVGQLANTGGVRLPLTTMRQRVHESRQSSAIESSPVVDWPSRPSQVSEIPVETDGISRDVAGYLKPRLTAVGNAIVPQCAEAIARAILAADATRKA
jgi:DNA (cytosine-5)-methyltransferase 1